MKSLAEVNGFQIGPYDEKQWAVWKIKPCKRASEPGERHDIKGYYPSPWSAVQALSRLVADTQAKDLSHWSIVYKETANRILKAIP